MCVCVCVSVCVRQRLSSSLLSQTLGLAGTRWDFGIWDLQTRRLWDSLGLRNSLGVWVFIPRQQRCASADDTHLEKHPALLVHLLVVAVEIAQVRFETLDFGFGILDLFAEILLDVTFDGTFESSADLLQ